MICIKLIKYFLPVASRLSGKRFKLRSTAHHHRHNCVIYQLLYLAWPLFNFVQFFVGGTHRRDLNSQP